MEVEDTNRKSNIAFLMGWAKIADLYFGLIHQNISIKGFIPLGTIFILCNGNGVGGWSRKWQFSLTLSSKNGLMWGVDGSKKPQKTLT